MKADSVRPQSVRHAASCLPALLAGTCFLILTGCGTTPAAAPTTAATQTVLTTTPSASATPSAAPASTAPVATHRALTFTYRSPQGWQYRLTEAFPHVFEDFSTSIATSPPGEAKVAADLQGTLQGLVTASTVNPGRPDGPTISLVFSDLIYPMPAALGEHGSIGGICTWGNSWQPGSDVLACPLAALNNLSEEDLSMTNYTADLKESVARGIVSQLQDGPSNFELRIYYYLPGADGQSQCDLVLHGNTGTPVSGEAQFCTGMSVSVSQVADDV